ncbi:hypothetical protein CFB35_01170 [Burkholderia sp. AU16482]|nr:hypothetical protein CFB35_01170 [Burkholderia sp. AU16482]
MAVAGRRPVAPAGRVSARGGRSRTGRPSRAAVAPYGSCKKSHGTQVPWLFHCAARDARHRGRGLTSCSRSRRQRPSC